jgi:hypothetical protein
VGGVFSSCVEVAILLKGLGLGGNHTYRVSRVINAPLKFVYDWCTDFRENDNKIPGSRTRIILQKTFCRRPKATLSSCQPNDCEPLHHKVDIIKRNIPRLRKISTSAWVDFDKAVGNVRDEIVLAWKPNPAVFAAPVWDPEMVRKDMEEKLEKAKNCIVEMHWEWAQIAAEVTKKYGA